ncbi:branched-chain amino acid ABC transporter permease [Gordoniibacillus kamchatkensis]|uniref:Branched-chain amino acid ABC transporter permease n=1 Tax=Gordoniibacillus kamchatkensis TaxID=1590651 RepID=A0ABR5AF64_9BACL|nr:ABC transporter permease [Paenibacillus sp. VKM B-2647]KIL39690.1 branched-chain amino acid ABC transporter permease [Paenibacillus sp. VKM B-2647]
MGKLLRWIGSDSFVVSLVAILLGLICGAIIMLIGGYNPIVAYIALFQKIFGSPYDIGETIREITPLILTGLSVAFAFRTGLFNIGAEGQFLIGMTGATFVGVKLSGLPWIVHAPLAVIVGALAGGLWGALAGWLKASRGVNEVITTIMLNWIGLFLSNYIVASFLLQPGQQRSYMIQDTASMSLPWLAAAFGNARLHWGTVVALLAAVVFYIILWRTKLGYELRAVGHNPHAAQYAGMNVNRRMVTAMFTAGIFAGLAGVFEVLGVFHYQTVMAASPGYGFDGIAVSLLGMNNPFGVVLGAALFGGLTYGSAGMSFGADVPPEIIRIVIGSVIFFVATQGIVRYVLLPFYKRRGKEVAKA